MYGNFIRVYANETRATTTAKTDCRDCGLPCTWFTTVAKEKPILIDGHDPVPVRTEHDPQSHRLTEIHSRDTVHFATCPKRRMERETR